MACDAYMRITVVRNSERFSLDHLHNDQDKSSDANGGQNFNLIPTAVVSLQRPVAKVGVECRANCIVLPGRTGRIAPFQKVILWLTQELKAFVKS